MTDLEMTKLCAEAMGYQPVPHPNRRHMSELMWVANGGNYNPLHDDAQAMALVKKFGITIKTADGKKWCIEPLGNPIAHCIDEATDINRAIVECVAKMVKK